MTDAELTRLTVLVCLIASLIIVTALFLQGQPIQKQVVTSEMLIVLDDGEGNDNVIIGEVGVFIIKGSIRILVNGHSVEEKIKTRCFRVITTKHYKLFYTKVGVYITNKETSYEVYIPRSGVVKIDSRTNEQKVVGT